MLEEKDIQIVDGKKEDWEKAVAKNSYDSYSLACYLAAVGVMEALDMGKTPEEAEAELTNTVPGMTGFMAGAAASVVVHFSTRGEEFKAWWNRNQGGSGEEEGTINPAVMTISENEK